MTDQPIAAPAGEVGTSGITGVQAPVVRHASTPAQVEPTAIPGVRDLLNVIVAVVIVAALYFGKDVLLPITLAVLLSFVLNPAVDALTRLRLPRAPAVLLTIAAALSLIGVLGTIVVGQTSSLAEDAPRYAKTIEGKVGSVRDYIAARTEAVTSKLSVAPRSEGARKAALERARATNLSNAQATLRRSSGTAPIVVQVQENEPTAFDVARQLLTPILGPLETFVIVITISIFILISREDLRDRFIRVFGSADLHRTTTAMDDAAARLSRYFVSQLMVNTSFGLVIWLGLYFIGIPSAALWGVLAGLLRFVPYIGPILAGVAPLALAAAIDPGWSLLVYVAILFAVVELATGYVIEPLLYGHSTGLSPVSVLVAAVFWTWIWGPIGLIISTPLTLCFVVLGRHVKSLEFLDVLLGDRPPLSPVEMFYQRLLANNTEEALEQAEALIAEGTLVGYYDEVAREGLKLARADVRRGAMTREKGKALVDTMLSIIHDLPEEETGPSSQSSPAAPVICIAGRGMFDAPVAAMVAQLLHREGVAAETMGFARVTRDSIDAEALRMSTVLCITCLDGTGMPAYLRALVRRLRSAAPEATVVLGCWRTDNTAVAGVSSTAIDPLGDAQASSLADLVKVCMQSVYRRGKAGSR